MRIGFLSLAGMFLAVAACSPPAEDGEGAVPADVPDADTVEVRDAADTGDAREPESEVVIHHRLFDGTVTAPVVLLAPDERDASTCALAGLQVQELGGTTAQVATADAVFEEEAIGFMGVMPDWDNVPCIETELQARGGEQPASFDLFTARYEPAGDGVWARVTQTEVAPGPSVYGPLTPQIGFTLESGVEARMLAPRIGYIGGFDTPVILLRAAAPFDPDDREAMTALLIELWSRYWVQIGQHESEIAPPDQGGPTHIVYYMADELPADRFQPVDWFMAYLTITPPPAPSAAEGDQ